MKKGPNVKKLTKFHISSFLFLQIILLTIVFVNFNRECEPITYEDLKHETIVVEKKAYTGKDGSIIFWSNGKMYRLGWGGAADGLPHSSKLVKDFHVGDTLEIAYYDNPMLGRVIYGLKRGDTEYFNAYEAVDSHNFWFKFNWWFLVIGELHAFAIIIVPKALEARALRKIEKNQERRKEKRLKQLEQRNANIKKE